jgi:hypothetical protein
MQWRTSESHTSKFLPFLLYPQKDTIIYVNMRKIETIKTMIAVTTNIQNQQCLTSSYICCLFASRYTFSLSLKYSKVIYTYVDILVCIAENKGILSHYLIPLSHSKLKNAREWLQQEGGTGLLNLTPHKNIYLNKYPHIPSQELRNSDGGL